jgi:protein SCO1
MKRAARRLLLVGALVIAAVGAAHAGEASAPGPREAGLEPHLGGPVPRSPRFHASDGRELAFGEVLERGKPVLLVLAYNRCNMLCSLVLRSVSRLMLDFGLRPGDDFSLVTISIDPRDTVFEASRMQAALLDAAGYEGQTRRWTFLVGEPPAIDAVAGALGFRYRWDPSTEQYAHPAVLFTLSPEGKVTGYYDGLAPDREALRAALSGAGGTGPAALLTGAILDCFRFQGMHSRYGTTLAWLLRGGAASVGLALFALVWRLMRRQQPSLRGQP